LPSATENKIQLENNLNKVGYGKPRQLLTKRKQKNRFAHVNWTKVDVVVAIVVATFPPQAVATSRTLSASDKKIGRKPISMAN
jgi:hypothetical protein